MVELTLTAEQLKLLQGHPGEVVFRDPAGELIGYLNRSTQPSFTPEEIAAAKRSAASKGPRYTTEQVLEHLRSLDAP